MSSDVFLTAVKKLTDANLTVIELIDAAERLRAAGEIELVTQLYKIWISFNQENRLLYVAYFNYSVVLSGNHDYAGAKDALERAIASNPDFHPAYINLGSVYEKLGQLDEAVSRWLDLSNRLAQITGSAIGFKTEALKQVGRILEAHQRLPLAENALKQSLEINPNQRDVAQHFIAARLVQCEWPVVVPWDGVSRDALMKGFGPLSMAVYTDDPLLQLATAWRYGKESVGYPAPRPEADRRTSSSTRLRVGYISSDLRDHAIGYLMAELFELHDRKAVEVFAYYSGTPPSGAVHTRIKSAVEHWVDITGMNDEAAAARIAADGVDILVDVNGYTRDARTKVFAMRPAPILVNWLGYPGTMGTPYHQYIIADDWIIPPDHEMYYTEKVARLPCYQPNDRKRVISPQRPTRADAGLPDDAFVYCCFNGCQKISRFTFERWLTILQRVPKSVLWLLDAGDANTLLKTLAEQRGISPDRVVFAAKLANPLHLARYPLGDLFLDTAPYGAHTTASDALWMGVPILTLTGRSFASRVCGSLARSAGLADFVCATPEEYIERAVSLGNNPAEMQRYKQQLAANRNSCVLFDMNLLTSRLEGLYKQMWNDLQNGAIPRPDPLNLDVYQDVGIEHDHDAVEMMGMKDYHGWYKERLVARHQRCPIPPDRRLWTENDIAHAEGRVEEQKAPARKRKA